VSWSPNFPIPPFFSQPSAHRPHFFPVFPSAQFLYASFCLISLSLSSLNSCLSCRVKPNHTCRRRTLHAVGTSCLLAPVGSRAFPVTSPQTWNDLLEDVTSAESLATFHRLLKTHLFSESFPDYLLDINWLSPVDIALVQLLRPPNKSFNWLIETIHVRCDSVMSSVTGLVCRSMFWSLIPASQYWQRAVSTTISRSSSRQLNSQQSSKHSPTYGHVSHINDLNCVYVRTL